VTQEECPATLLESFRILRANVLLALRDPKSRIITITSPQAGEGKSTTVVNLASMISMSSKRVLVVDCDLRHPSIHRYFGLENKQGLTSVLQGTASLDDCLQGVNGEYLQVLTAGPTPTHSPELLVSGELAALLATVQERYDCILLDSPPLLNLSDGVLLASLAHAAVMVVAFDRTRQEYRFYDAGH
jgi:capsular exopolysaccharide synthesis family protein